MLFWGEQFAYAWEPVFMDVVILCGGQGARMREETEYRPKPMVEVGGRPLLWHIMRLFGHHGLNRFVLCLGYKGSVIKDYFLNYEAMTQDCTVAVGGRRQVSYHGNSEPFDFEVTLADTGVDTMTGGRVKRVEQHVKSDTFMVTYGDGLSNVDIKKLLAFHQSHGKLATVTTVQPVSRFGITMIDGQSRVTSFSEKPKVEGWVSAGFFVFNRKIFDYLGGGDAEMLETEPLERLAREGQLMAYKHDGFFFPVDTYRDYLYVNDLWKDGEAAWKVW
jgi:glucose-1-phosphate cytidylyltransferase